MSTVITPFESSGIISIISRISISPRVLTFNFLQLFIDYFLSSSELSSVSVISSYSKLDIISFQERSTSELKGFREINMNI